VGQRRAAMNASMETERPKTAVVVPFQSNFNVAAVAANFLRVTKNYM
jgi:hypothetical protein